MSLIQTAKDNARKIINARFAVTGHLMQMSRHAIEGIPEEKLERFTGRVNAGNESCIGLWIIRYDVRAAESHDHRDADYYTTPVGVIRGTFREAHATALMLAPIAHLFEVCGEFDSSNLYEVEFVVDTTADEEAANSVMTLDQFYASKRQLKESAFEITDLEYYRNAETTSFCYGPEGLTANVFLDHDTGDYVTHYGEQMFIDSDETKIIMAAFMIYLMSIGQLNDDEGEKLIGRL